MNAWSFEIAATAFSSDYSGSLSFCSATTPLADSLFEHAPHGFDHCSYSSSKPMATELQLPSENDFVSSADVPHVIDYFLDLSAQIES